MSNGTRLFGSSRTGFGLLGRLSRFIAAISAVVLMLSMRVPIGNAALEKAGSAVPLAAPTPSQLLVDEFDGAGLDPSRWTIVSGGPGIQVSGGLLVLQGPFGPSAHKRINSLASFAPLGGSITAQARISLSGDYQKFGFVFDGSSEAVYFDTLDPSFNGGANFVHALALPASGGTNWLIDVKVPVSWSAFHDFAVTRTASEAIFAIDGQEVARTAYAYTGSLPVGVWNDRPATMQVDRVVVTGSSSLALDGHGYAEAPHAAELNLTGDWTVELWFKDENPGGYTHDYQQLLIKGDPNVEPEAPYVLTLGNKQLLAGVRSRSVYSAVTYNFGRSLTPNTWHHVAATFQASTRTLTLYLDGVQVAQDALDRVSTGNSLPVDLGRAGTSGKFFTGKLDDVRLWNVVRSSQQIADNYKAQVSGSAPGLVANWTFDDGAGTSAADSTTPPENAALQGGASFSADVHP